MTGTTAEWLDYLARVRRLSPNTVATYARSLRTFPGVSQADRAAVEVWWESHAHKAISTRLNELAAIRSYFAWQRRFDHRLPTDDPTYRIEAPRRSQGTPHPVSRHDLLVLLEGLPEELRRAVALGAYGGLRIAEVAQLDWRDVDREINRIRVHGKGRKERLVGLSPLLLDHLLPDTGGNVVTAGGPTLSATVLGKRVNRAIQGQGVEATFHGLRHRFGTIALASTGNLLAVSRAMGHESPATTAIYTAASDADLDVIAEAVTR